MYFFGFQIKIENFQELEEKFNKLLWNDLKIKIESIVIFKLKNNICYLGGISGEMKVK